VSRARTELGDAAGIEPAAVHVILTGGLSAAPWARDVAGIDVIDPDLTLRGLAILHAEVAGGEPLRMDL
jgi:pantothenate kinase type III